ncbi:hypothetical protein FRC01_004676 [Tulasnella sp. 417]|nr:hypothetical protein FRC01_004676 [Tulasnella sp. 417]
MATLLATLWFSLFGTLGVAALPSQGPTRTTPPRRTLILTARAQSSSTTAPTEPILKGPAATAVTILTILLFAALFGFLIAKKCGVEFHCNRAKKALGRRGRGKKPAPLSPPPTPPPMDEHQITLAHASVAQADPSFGKLDGWVPPPQPPPSKEPPRQIATSYVDPTFSKLDGYSEEPRPQNRPPSATLAHTDSTPAKPSSPPPYPEPPKSSDAWKQGTVTGETTESWKQ